MKRMVGCVVEVASSLLWFCVYRNDQGGCFRDDQDVQTGDRIIRPDVCSKFDVCPQVVKVMIKHVIEISPIICGW